MSLGTCIGIGHPGESTPAGPGSGVDNLLLEDASDLLLEDEASVFLLE
jgi:hypothetical protein